MINNSVDARKILGKKGELLVQEYLEKNGFQIVCQNYTTKYGEVDIIANSKDILTFVEVKLRNSEYFQLSQIILQNKKNKIIKTALNFISKAGIPDKSIRFDVAIVILKDNNYKINYIENAFTSDNSILWCR